MGAKKETKSNGDKPWQSHDEAIALLKQIKPNADMIPVIAMLKGVLEAQAVKQRIREQYFAGQQIGPALRSKSLGG
jgi:hypothetical protein